jgi:hypothetical protein
MGRPAGVSLIAISVVGFSLFLASRVWAYPLTQINRPVLTAAGLLVLLALVAGKALWSLRPHAFLAFILWGLCAIVAVALVGMRSPAGARGVHVMPMLVYTGAGLAVAAVYLRRVV